MNKALFWDFDGTLVHANEGFLTALRAALAREGCNVADEVLRAFLRESCSWNIWQETYPERTGSAWWDTLFEKCSGLYSRWGLSTASYGRVNEAFRRGVISYDYAVYSDAAQVLAGARELGWRNYVISNNYPELPDVVARLGLAPYFEDYFVSASIGYDKPQPEIFRRALEGARAPDRCYMIGDNPVADIRGAKAMGMGAILVHKPGSFEADYHFDALLPILELLD